MAEPPPLPGERATLNQFLDHYRTEVVAKLRGVSEADARRRLVPSLTTLGGLVKHLTVTEESWFLRRVGGQDLGPRIPAEAEFTLTDEDTVESLIAAYENQCALSREVAAQHEMDEPIQHERWGPLTVRWIIVHMIEETARHAGHADILREQIDAD